ncbi:hypothetical protein PP304_gp119 [Gordonia phage Phendrix]|uniref:Uncharacterized protein n=2 Tax=Godonkavirus TaxID=2733178 RepID=A0A4D6E471_9CAUD|nr:hypothetical protein HOV33_gp018 [Gordonia phage GodonK]YP_009821597.1 hypothetical protein HOV33_gp124 [Gordonia phage GodonK]YP_010649062.1 hypothetical protein PP304_gp018 [Gordonia phage Phendrix]YP_010649248.1 hypothetical protein PP304_gp119 [Gordonia phage Phendrix]QBZ72637.1 hypothetical protein SEA_GODONK_18 [Gordonia phage GodonK]QBZ72832.1 hypothetical protein SEA_GODONK_244 [Gordonia phage GodonK]QDK02566.1 hypothetical protein SEA_PHENDRIX_18 [Gordonia phage Phendrix]QDK02750
MNTNTNPQPTAYDLAHLTDTVSEDGTTCECGQDVSDCAATPNTWRETI